MQEKPAEDFDSVEKAARLLGREPERIRQMLHAGELIGVYEGEGKARPVEKKPRLGQRTPGPEARG